MTTIRNEAAKPPMMRSKIFSHCHLTRGAHNMSAITMRTGMGPTSHHAIPLHQSTIQQGIGKYLLTTRLHNRQRIEPLGQVGVSS